MFRANSFQPNVMKFMYIYFFFCSTGQPDVCGECKGGGKKCLKIVDFNPKAIPANTNANVSCCFFNVKFILEKS